MGSKSRIHLGYIIDFILHFHRNFFTKTKIFMSKRVHDKIKIKHNNIYNLTTAVQFNYLMKSTIGSCKYSKSNDTLNFIAYLEDQNKFVLYSLKAEKHHCICSTIFSLKKETLKKYYEDESFKLFNNRYKNKIESFLY